MKKMTRKEKRLLSLAVLWMVTILLLFSAFPLLTVAEEDFVYVSDLNCTYWKMFQSASDNPASPYRPSFDSNEHGGTLTIADVAYEKGIRTHPDGDAPAVLEYDISGLSYRYFTATVGKDSLGGDGLIQFAVAVDGETRYTSRELAFGECEFIQCSVEGGNKLELYVFNVDGCSFDSAAFGNAMLTNIVSDDSTPEIPLTNTYDPERDDFKGEYTPPFTGEEDHIFVSDLKWMNWRMYSAHSGQASPMYSPSFDCNEAGGTLVINDVSYEKGIRTHPDATAPADIVYDISEYSEKYGYFIATVGRDSASAGGGFVRFVVLVDGNVVAESPDLTIGEDFLLCAEIRGARLLTLRVDGTEDGFHHDSSGWGGAMLTNISLQTIEMVEFPFKLTYKEGDAFNPAGGIIRLVYENGVSTLLDMTADMIEGFDSTHPGTKKLTVTYEGKTLSFDITIEEEETVPPVETPTEPTTDVPETPTEPMTDAPETPTEPTTDVSDESTVEPEVSIQDKDEPESDPDTSGDTQTTESETKEPVKTGCGSVLHSLGSIAAIIPVMLWLMLRKSAPRQKGDE